MKALIYFIENHGINWPLIWSDCSIYAFIWLFLICFIVIWAAKNYKDAIREEYLVKKDYIQNEYLEKTTSKLCAMTTSLDKLTDENKFLHQVFADYKNDATNELIEKQTKINDLEEENKKLSMSVRKRDEKGHFLPTSGNGHGKKKALIL